MIMYLSG